MDLRELISEVTQLPPAHEPQQRGRRWFWTAVIVVAFAAVAVVAVQKWRAPRVHAPLPSKVPEANEYLQRALLFANHRQDLRRLRQLLEKALELDPHFALHV